MKLPLIRVADITMSVASQPGLTSDVFVKAREPSTVRQLVDELIGDGIERERIRVHAARNLRGLDLPVERVVYRTPTQAVIEGTLYGALFTIPVVALLFLIGAGGISLLAFFLGLAVGGGFGMLHARIANQEVAAQADALSDGELVVVLELDQATSGEVEDRIKARHPEVAVLGSDPAGTPPFP
jgi:hypothetical protein